MHKAENLKKWEETVNAWKNSGLSQKEYCSRSNLSVSTLHGWCHKLKKYYLSNNVSNSKDFTKINFKSPGTVFSPTSGNQSGIRLFLGKNISINLDSGFDRNEFQKTISAILEII